MKCTCVFNVNLKTSPKSSILSDLQSFFFISSHLEFNTSFVAKIFNTRTVDQYLCLIHFQRINKAFYHFCLFFFYSVLFLIVLYTNLNFSLMNIHRPWSSQFYPCPWPSFSFLSIFFFNFTKNQTNPLLPNP